MNTMISLHCNTCGRPADVDARTTLVMARETARATFWQCPACSATQWTTMPNKARDAIRAGARQCFDRAQYMIPLDGVCGRASVVPLRELTTYSRAEGTFVIWHCQVCMVDRVSALAPEGVFRIVQAGGVSLSPAEGAMIELLQADDYQPHAAMAAAGFPFNHKRKGAHDA